MKKYLNEHTPKGNAWSNLQEKRQFENQLNQHIHELPVLEPRSDTWAGIQGKMEKKKRIAFYLPLLVAASVAGILWLGSFLFNTNLEQNSEIKNSDQFISKVDQSPESSPIQRDEEVTLPKAEEVIPKELSNDLETGAIDRIIEEPIRLAKDWLAEMPLAPTRPMDLATRGQFIPTLEEEKATLHQVTISWGMKDQRKFRIGQPKENPILAEDQLVGRETIEKKNQLLNFKIK